MTHRLHIAGAGSQMRWSSLDLTRFLDRLNPKLIHLGFRPYGPVLGSLRHVLRRLPRLEYLSVRPSHVDFDLFIHAETSQLRHLELRDAATDVNVAAGPAGVAQAEQSLVDEGFSWSSKSMIALGSRRALEAARSGFALDRNLVLRLSSVVTIEAAILAEEGGRGVEKVGTGCATTIEADEADEAAVAQALTMED